MRSRHRQQEITFPTVDKNGQHRGGSRPGAGRKPRNGVRAMMSHLARPDVNRRDPQHVTLRVVREVGWMRRPKAYRAIRRALAVVIDRHHDFRIVHFSLQRDHVHLLCEAENKQALARGVQGFEISAAKHLNRACQRAGRVFSDRYYVESIDSVRQVRHALAYVLNNWRKHQHDGVGLFRGRIDPFSSGMQFAGWKEPLDGALPPDYERPRVAIPQCWLLAEGWKRAAPISVFEIPGDRRRRTG